MFYSIDKDSDIIVVVLSLLVTMEGDFFDEIMHLCLEGCACSEAHFAHDLNDIVKGNSTTREGLTIPWWYSL